MRHTLYHRPNLKQEQDNVTLKMLILQVVH
jgi:hypothetical protein